MKFFITLPCQDSETWLVTYGKKDVHLCKNDFRCRVKEFSCANRLRNSDIRDEFIVFSILSSIN